MSREQKLVEKIQRQTQKVRRLAPDYEKINLQPYVLAKADGGTGLAGNVIANNKRQFANDFGFDVVAQKIQIGELLPPDSASLARVSYGTGYALQLTLSDATAETDYHIGVNDLIEVGTGLLAGYYYNIVEVSSANTFILDSDAPDGASYPGESGLTVKHFVVQSKPQFSVTPSEQV